MGLVLQRKNGTEKNTSLLSLLLLLALLLSFFANPKHTTTSYHDTLIQQSGKLIQDEGGEVGAAIGQVLKTLRSDLETAGEVDVLQLSGTLAVGQVEQAPVRELAAERQAQELQVHAVPVCQSDKQSLIC